MITILFITVAFFIWFASLWVSILSLLSFIGGWNKLSRIFPVSLPDRETATVKYSMSSLKIGLVSYRYCTAITFTGTGIILEMPKIFSIMHKPLLIPYNRISDVRKRENFSASTEFTAGEKKILIYGKAGEKFYSEAATLKASL